MSPEGRTTRWLSGTPSAERHVGFRSEIGEQAAPGPEHAETPRGTPAIVADGRRLTSYAPADTATRNTSDAGSDAPPATRARGPIVHEIAHVGAAFASTVIAEPETSTCNEPAAPSRIACRSARPFASVRVNS